MRPNLTLTTMPKDRKTQDVLSRRSVACRVLRTCIENGRLMVGDVYSYKALDVYISGYRFSSYNYVCVDAGLQLKFTFTRFYYLIGGSEVSAPNLSH